MVKDIQESRDTRRNTDDRDRTEGLELYGCCRRGWRNIRRAHRQDNATVAMSSDRADKKIKLVISYR